MLNYLQLFIIVIILIILCLISQNNENFQDHTQDYIQSNTMVKYVDIHKTDKLHHHKYYRFYPQYLDFLNNNKYNNTGIIEIGLYEGDSLNLWLDYFHSKHIYGIDIKENKFTNNRYTIFQGDQSKLEDLQKISNQLKHDIYFIIDDGSHHPDHQIISFNYFFDKVLKFDGVYIIEDIETSYWKNANIYGYDVNFGYKYQKSTIEIFKNLIDFVNRRFLNNENLNTVSNKLIDDGLSIDVCRLINNISFGENNIIIKKVANIDMILPTKCDYNHKHNL
jgi:hypothetical protein